MTGSAASVARNFSVNEKRKLKFKKQCHEKYYAYLVMEKERFHPERILKDYEPIV